MTFEWDEKKNKQNIMTLDEVKAYVPSQKELDRIRNFKNTDFSDNPKLTAEELKQFKPWYEVHPNGSDIYKVTVKKTPVQIRIDSDVLQAFKAKGRGYQTRINTVLRRAVASGQY